jgi:L-aspartate oxidase
VAAQLKQWTWERLGLSRDEAGLERLLALLAPLRAEWRGSPSGRSQAETRNLLDVAWAMGVCARFRRESRGGHYRTDHPGTDAAYLGHTLLDAAPRLVDVETPLAVGV